MSAASPSRLPVLELVLGAFGFSLMSLFARLAGERLPSQQMVAARAGVALLLTIVLLRRARVWPWGEQRGLLVLRGLFGFGALSCFFYAVVNMPLAEATVIQYTSPIFTALIAAMTLGEAISFRLLVATGLGFGGVLLIARPAALFGAAAQTVPGTVVLIAFLGAFLTACAYVMVRKLIAREHELVIIFYFMLISLPASLPGLAGGAFWPTGREWLLLLAVGVSAQVAQVAMTRGMRQVPVGSATVIMYMQILFATLWGLLFLGEVPDLWTLAGALAILAGTAVVALGRRTPPARRARAVAGDLG